MHLPAKLKDGDQLRAAVVTTVNSIIDFLTSTHLISGSGIRIQNYAHGTVISTAAAPAVAASGTGVVPTYNGYFTLKDISTYNEDGTVKTYRVAVCNGDSWDSSKQTSGDSYFAVNTVGSYYPVSCTKLTIPNSGVVLLRYCHGTKKADVVFRKEHPYGNTGYYYCVLGSVKIADGKMSITQLHGYGANSIQTANGTFVAYASLNNLVPTIEIKDYTGFFCIRMIEPAVKNDGSVGKPSSFAICDGNTWDPEGKTSQASVVAVNNRVWNLESKVLTFETHSYIAIKYDYNTDADATAGDPVSINTYKESVPSGVYDNEAYGIIGHLGDNWKQLTQIHTAGVLQIWAFTQTCDGGSND